jgi:hypothetical protein
MNTHNCPTPFNSDFTVLKSCRILHACAEKSLFCALLGIIIILPLSFYLTWLESFDRGKYVRSSNSVNRLVLVGLYDIHETFHENPSFLRLVTPWDLFNRSIGDDETHSPCVQLFSLTVFDKSSAD